MKEITGWVLIGDDDDDERGVGKDAKHGIDVAGCRSGTCTGGVKDGGKE